MVTNKWGAKDRYDGIKFSQQKFWHTNWRVSNELSQFHCDVGYIEHYTKHKNIVQNRFGVQKRIWRASNGMQVDESYVGQYE